MKRRVIAFDLDNTLADSKSPISQQMVVLLDELLTKFQVCVISGGKFAQFEEQLLNPSPSAPRAKSRVERDFGVRASLGGHRQRANGAVGRRLQRRSHSHRYRAAAWLGSNFSRGVCPEGRVGTIPRRSEGYLCDGGGTMRRIFVLTVVVTALVGAGGSAYAASQHAMRAQTAGKADLVKTVNVAASEFKFVLSAKSAGRGLVIFKVKNIGKLAHDFKINGRKSKMLSPGQSDTLRVTFLRKGTYPYICTVPGHAPAGMKGVFAIS